MMNDNWTILTAADKDESLLLVLEQVDANGNIHYDVVQTSDPDTIQKIFNACGELLGEGIEL